MGKRAETTKAAHEFGSGVDCHLCYDLGVVYGDRVKADGTLEQVQTTCSCPAGESDVSEVQR